MDGGFDFSEATEDANASFLDAFGKLTSGNNFFDAAQRAVMVVVLYLDRKVCAPDAGTFALFKMQLKPFETQSSDPLTQFVRIRPGVGQRAEQHVAADTGKAV